MDPFDVTFRIRRHFLLNSRSTNSLPHGTNHWKGDDQEHVTRKDLECIAGAMERHIKRVLGEEGYKRVRAFRLDWLGSIGIGGNCR